MPYAPQNTACVTLGYEHPFRNDRRIRASATWNGVGRIWWDEANTAFQPFYSLLDAKVGLTIGHLDISIWGSNLLNTGYGTFRFRSVGRDFIAAALLLCNCSIHVPEVPQEKASGYVGTFHIVNSDGVPYQMEGRTGQLVREDGRMDVILREVSFSPRMPLTMDIGGCPSSYRGIKK